MSDFGISLGWTHAKSCGSYLAVYITLLVVAITVYCSSFLVYLFGSLRASRFIHNTLVKSVLSSTLR